MKVTKKNISLQRRSYCDDNTIVNLLTFSLFFIGKVDSSIQTATKCYCEVLQDMESHETIHNKGEKIEIMPRVHDLRSSTST